MSYLSACWVGILLVIVSAVQQSRADVVVGSVECFHEQDGRDFVQGLITVYTDGPNVFRVWWYVDLVATEQQYDVAKPGNQRFVDATVAHKSAPHTLVAMLEMYSSMGGWTPVDIDFGEVTCTHQ